MMRFIDTIKSALPGVFVHSIRIGGTAEEDRKRSLLDNMNRQIQEVCDQLAGIPELSGGFNGIGLSQGGQFLRAYVERCNKPRVKKLITIGSQHQGVMALPGCVENELSRGALSIEESEAKAASDASKSGLFSFLDEIFGGTGPLIHQFLAVFKAENAGSSNCAWWKRFLKMGVYSPFVRSQVVQAQYFKDPANPWAFYLTQTQKSIEIALAQGGKVLLLGQPCIGAWHEEQQAALFRFWREKYSADPRIGYLDLARELDLKDPQLAPDGMHLSLKGHQKLAPLLVPVLLQMRGGS
ncbi:hypothetical protein EBZ37_08020 [bacterium]|nr:hypothetical protein [bacterium]